MNPAAVAPVAVNPRQRFAEYVAQHASNVVKTALLAEAIGRGQRTADSLFLIDRLREGASDEGGPRAAVGNGSISCWKGRRLNRVQFLVQPRWTTHRGVHLGEPNFRGHPTPHFRRWEGMTL